jgi:hypothetical protein
VVAGSDDDDDVMVVMMVVEAIFFTGKNGVSSVWGLRLVML